MKTNLLRFISIFLIIFIAINTVSAQAPEYWNITGIGGGGSMFCPSINPDDNTEFYVACDMGQLFHTNDLGLSYEIVDFNRITASVNTKVCFTNGPVRYSINYADDKALPVKSTDGGVTWNTLSGNPDEWEETWSIWADYQHPDRVIISYWDLLWFSNDGGNTFRQIHSAQEPGAGIVTGGVFFDDNNIYIGTNDGIIYSSDGGNTFNTLTTTGIPADQRIFSFAAAKSGDTTRFVCLTGSEDDVYLGVQGTDYWGFMKGVYSMDNLSGQWTERMNGIDPDADFLMFTAMAGNDINTVYLGGSTDIGYPNVMKATVSGTSWEWQHVFHTEKNQNIFTGWCGEGGDRDWGYPETLFGITVSATDKNTVLISDMAFVTKSTDGGETWTQAYVSAADQNPAGQYTPKKQNYHSVGLENTSAWSLAWYDNDHLFAGYADIFAILSDDGGSTWSYNYNAPVTNSVYCVVKHNTTPMLYAATSSVHDLYKSYILEDWIIDNGIGQILFSTTAGYDWDVLHDFGHPVYWLAIDPNNDKTMYASVVHHTDGGIFVTHNLHDGGASVWTKLPSPPRTEGHPAAITVLNNGKVLCSFSGRRDENGDFIQSSGIFLYDPATGSWDDKSDPNQYYWCHDVVVDPSDPTQNTWYSCVYNGWGGNGNDMGGLYRTSDGGEIWTKIFDEADVSSCTFNYLSDRDELYVTTNGKGLWLSSDINDPEPEFQQVESYHFAFPERVFIDPYDNNLVWITSFGNGLQYGEINPDNVPNNKADVSALSVYPNPSTGICNVEVKGNTGFKNIEIFNSAGNIILKKSFKKDIFQYRLDISRFPTGVYVLAVDLGKEKKVIKLIKE